MLKLCEGGFYSRNRDAVIEEVQKCVARGERCYLIVPEQQTLLTESEMARVLPASAPLCFEVSNFSRFANSVFRELGGVAKEYCDRTRRMLVMWRTLSELSPTLSMTKTCKEINTGLVDKAIRAVVKMQSAAIDSDALLECAQSERLSANERLQSKLSDLSMIMSLYKKLLAEKFSDSTDDVALVCRVLEENADYLRGAHIFVEGFTSFTEPQYQLLSILMRRASLTVALTLPKLFSDSIEYTEPRGARERLISLANRYSCEVRLSRCDACREDTAPLLREVGELMWQNFSSIDYEAYGDEERAALSVYEAREPYEMCDFVAADIRRRVMMGNRYRDFAIIARDADSYAGILASSLTSYDIPHFISRGREVSSFEAIKLISCAYKVIASDFDRESLISYAKCSLCGISREACDEFEEYTHRWQINKSRFYDGMLWNMSPYGLDAEQGDVGESLKRINETRAALVEPLKELGELLCDAHTVSEHASALVAFLNRIRLEEEIARQAEELIRIGEASLGEDCKRLWKIICDSLDMLVDTLGTLPSTSDGFANLLTIAFSGAKVGRIPSYCDEVTVGSADMIRLSGKRHVYIIGVNAGEFPRAIKDSAYFTERDKATLASLGLGIDKENEIEYSKELFAFSRAFSYARESVTLLYSTAAQDFSKSEKSPIIDRICEICQEKLTIKHIYELDAMDFVYTPKSALASLGRLDGCQYMTVKGALEDGELAGLLHISETDIENRDMRLSENTLADIYPSDIRLSQSRIERYNSCPLAYFCDYNLALNEYERESFDARNIGSFIHSILENFFREVRDEKIVIADMSDEQKREMVSRHAGKYVKSLSADSLLGTARAEVMLGRLVRSAMPVVEGLCREFAGCDFVPYEFELRIGNDRTGTLPSPVKFESEDGTGVYVAGIIDRVDTYKKDGDVYVRVVDYKTGKKDFKPSDLDEGENLQMFLYLKSIVDTENEKFRENIGAGKDGRLIPAGVIYVKTDLSDVTVPRPDAKIVDKELQGKQSRRGMILDDATSIGAMNPSYIPVKFTKTGEPDKRTAQNLYKIEEWDALMKKVEGAVVRTATRMKSGDVSTKPKITANKSYCEYCQYKPICRASKK